MKSLRNEKIDERKKDLKIIMRWKYFSSELKAKRDRDEDTKKLIMSRFAEVIIDDINKRDVTET